MTQSSLEFPCVMRLQYVVGCSNYSATERPLQQSSFINATVHSARGNITTRTQRQLKSAIDGKIGLAADLLLLFFRTIV